MEDTGDDVSDIPTSTENAPDPPSEEALEATLSDVNITANGIFPDANMPSHSAEISPEAMDEDVQSSALIEPTDSSLSVDAMQNLNTETSPNFAKNTENVAGLDQESAEAGSVNDIGPVITEDKEKDSHNVEGQQLENRSSISVEMMETTVSDEGACDQTETSGLEPGIDKSCEKSIRVSTVESHTKDSSDAPTVYSPENLNEAPVGSEKKELSDEPTASLEGLIDESSVGLKDKESTNEPAACLDEIIGEGSVGTKEKESSTKHTASLKEMIDETSVGPNDNGLGDEPIASMEDMIDEVSVGPKDHEANDEPTASMKEMIYEVSVGPKHNEPSDDTITSVEEMIVEASVGPQNKELSVELVESSEEKIVDSSVGPHDKQLSVEPAESSEEKIVDPSVAPKHTESSNEPIADNLKNMHDDETESSESQGPLTIDHKQESEVGSKPDDITKTSKTSKRFESENVLSGDTDLILSETTTQPLQADSVPVSDVNISIKLESIESLAGKSGNDNAVVDSTTSFIKSEIPEDVDMEKDAEKLENVNGTGRLQAVEDVNGERPGADEEGTVTMLDVLQEQEELEDDAEAVLGASDDKNCTYDEGYIKRQALYACLTCCSEARFDPTKRAGVCLACSLSCHDKHELIELYTKRNFRCDCGNPNFNTQQCTFIKDKTKFNTENQYNQNFSGLYCICHRPYPDPDSTVEDEMIQCIVCEDWLHSSHLDAKVPDNDLYSEMICKHCMDKNEFLNDYSDFAVNIDDSEEVDVINTVDKMNGHYDAEMVTVTKKLSHGGAEIENATEELSHSDSEMETATKECSHDGAEMENATRELSHDDAEMETVTKELSDFAEMEAATKKLDHDDEESRIAMNRSQLLSEPEKSDNISGQNEVNIEQKNVAELESENSCSDNIAGIPSSTDEVSTEGRNDVVTGNTDADDKVGPTATEEMVDASKANDLVYTDITDLPTGNAEIQFEDSSTSSKDISDAAAIAVNANNVENPISNEVAAVTCTPAMSVEDSIKQDTIDESTKASTAQDEDQQAKREQKDETEAGEVQASKPENELRNLVEQKEEKIGINLENNQTMTECQDKAGPIENCIFEKTRDDSDSALRNPGETLSSIVEDKKSDDVSTETIKLGTGNIEVSEAKDEDAELSETHKVVTEHVSEARNEDTEMSETDKEAVMDVEKESLTETVEENTDVDMTDDHEKKIEQAPDEEREPLEKNIPTENANKRKLSTEIVDNSEPVSNKKSKLSDCKRPKSTKRFKGATFWPCSWRQKLCSCSDCVEMYRDKNVLFLLDLEDTISAYEELGKAKSDGKSSQYVKGLKALSSLDRIQQINALTEYNRMKEKLLEYLISFKDRQEVVKVEDVEKFFSDIKPKRKNDGVYFCR